MKNDKGVITDLTPMQTSGTGNVATVTGVTGTEAAKNGVVKLGSAELTYAENAPIYMVAVDGTITLSGVASIAKDTNDTGVYYTTDGVLTAAMIQVVE